jgi:hypothetical protein
LSSNSMELKTSATNFLSTEVDSFSVLVGNKEGKFKHTNRSKSQNDLV